MKYWYVIFIVLAGGFFNPLSAYGQFVTKRLENIAMAIQLSADDTIKLPKGCNIDSALFFHDKPVHVVKNEYGEVCHIGYSIFNKGMRDENLCGIYDFLERYLLELSLIDSQEQKKIRLYLDNVIYEEKNIKNIKDTVPEKFFTIRTIENQKYEVKWRHYERYFHMAFNADCQLILGAMENELERIMLKRLQREARKDTVNSDIVLILDRYGYEKDTLGFNKKWLIDLIKGDCDEFSLRKKSETEEVLFAINHQLGYIHLVSFKPGQARMYAYISIHNVPGSFIEALFPVDRKIIINKKEEK